MASRKPQNTVEIATHSESDEDIDQQSSHHQGSVDMLKTAQDIVTSVGII
jgi:hypothetical protein